MKKIARFVFETAYGPFVAWCAAAFALLASVALSSPLGIVGSVLVWAMLAVFVVVTLAAIFAFFSALTNHRWGWALLQFFHGAIDFWTG